MNLGWPGLPLNALNGLTELNFISMQCTVYICTSLPLSAQEDMSKTFLSIDDLQEVHQEVQIVTSRWQYLVLALGVSHDSVEKRSPVQFRTVPNRHYNTACSPMTQYVIRYRPGRLCAQQLPTKVAETILP